MIGDVARSDVNNDMSSSSADIIEISDSSDHNEDEEIFRSPLISDDGNREETVLNLKNSLFNEKELVV